MSALTLYGHSHTGSTSLLYQHDGGESPYRYMAFNNVEINMFILPSKTSLPKALFIPDLLLSFRQVVSSLEKRKFMRIVI